MYKGVCRVFLLLNVKEEKKNALTTDHDLIFLLDYFLVFFVNQQRLPDLEICVYTESSRIKGHNPNHQVT